MQYVEEKIYHACEALGSNLRTMKNISTSYSKAISRLQAMANLKEKYEGSFETFSSQLDGYTDNMRVQHSRFEGLMRPITSRKSALRSILVGE